VGLALLFVLGVLGWVVFSAGDRDAGDALEDGSFRAIEDLRSGPSGDSKGDAKGSPSSAQPEGSRGRDSDASTPTIIRQKLAQPGADDAGVDQPRDGGASQDVFEWRDPDNRKMLGQRRWMATLPDAESQAIDETFDAPSPQRYPIDLQERRLGVEIAKDIVGDCFDRLRTRSANASGRITVGFDLEADGARARITNVAIGAKVDLDDREFEDCITHELAGVSFRSSEQGTMRVEYPFFFDGIDRR
jgi:hypothetical protein